MKNISLHLISFILTIFSLYLSILTIDSILSAIGYDFLFLKEIVKFEFFSYLFYEKWWLFFRSLDLSSAEESIAPIIIALVLFSPFKKVYSLFYYIVNKKISLLAVKKNIKDNLKETYTKAHSSDKIDLSNFLQIERGNFHKIYCLSKSDFFINFINDNDLSDAINNRFTIIHGRPFSGKSSFIAYLMQNINNSMDYIALYISKEEYEKFDISKYTQALQNFDRVYLFFDLNLGYDDDFQVLSCIYNNVCSAYKNSFIFVSSYESFLDNRFSNFSMKLENTDISVNYTNIINRHIDTSKIKFLSSDTLNQAVGGSKHYASMLPALIATCAERNGAEWFKQETLPNSNEHLQLILIQLFDIIVPINIAEKLFPISGLVEKASKRSYNICIRPMDDEKWYGVGYIAPVFAYKVLIDNYAAVSFEDFSKQYGSVIDRAISLYKNNNNTDILEFIRLLIHNLSKDRNFILEGVDPSQCGFSLVESHIDYLYEQVYTSGDPATKIRWAGTLSKIKKNNKYLCLSNATELLTMNARAKDAILNEPRLFIMAKITFHAVLKNCNVSEKKSVLKLVINFLTMFTLNELIESDYSFNKHSDFIRRVSSTISAYTDLWSMVIRDEGRNSEYQGRIKQELQGLIISDKSYLNSTVENIIALHIARITANTEWAVAKKQYLDLIHKDNLSVDFPQLKLKIILEMFSKNTARIDDEIYGFELWEAALEEYESNIKHLGLKDRDQFNQAFARYTLFHGNSLNDEQIGIICTILNRICCNNIVNGYGLRDIFDPIFSLMALNAKYPINQKNDFYKSKIFKEISIIAEKHYCDAGLCSQYNKIIWGL